MRKLALFATVALIAGTAIISASAAPKPPAVGDPVGALRQAMSLRMYGEHNSYRWTAIVTCRRLAGYERFRCTFRNGGEKGAALIFWSKTTHRPTVTFTSFECIVQSDRKGCP